MKPCRNPVSRGVARPSVAMAGIAAAMLLSMSLQAEDKYWTGATSAEWRPSASIYNWTNSAGTACGFVNGDSVHFDGVPERRMIELPDRVAPSNIVFDIENDMFITNYVGMYITKAIRFEKRGSGKLSFLSFNNDKNTGRPSTSYFNDSTNEVHVYGGILETHGANGQKQLGDASKGYKVFVHSGGTLNVVERNALGDANTRSEFTIYTNGVLSFAHTTDFNINFIGNLHLNGGTLVQPARAHSSGFLMVKDVFSFAGPEPYVFTTNQTGLASTNNRDYQYRLRLGTNTEFRVANITGDDAADVTFENPIVETISSGGCGFRKTGPGKMVLSTLKSFIDEPKDSEVRWPRGAITVEEGELELAAPLQIAPFGIMDEVPGPITVESNATLTVTGKMFIDIDATDLRADAVPRPLKVKEGGRIVFKNQAEAKHYAFGDIDVPDFSTLDFSGLSGTGSYGVLSLLGKVTMRGTNVWKLSQNTFPVAMANGDSNNWTRILLGNNNNPTEFCVHDITGDDGIDFLAGCMLFNQRDMVHTLWIPGGFVKTGAGTMVLENRNNMFEGNIEVKEGTLVLGYPDGHNVQVTPDKTYMGRLDADGRTITVSGTGTLLAPNRNTFFHPLWAAITNSPEFSEAKGKMWSYSHLIAKDGGHIRFTQHQFLDKIEFSGGSLSGHGNNGGYGIFTVYRLFKVSGTSPFFDGGDVVESDDNGNGHPDTNAILVNGEPQTEFNIADVTGDERDDATFYRPLAICYLYKNGILKDTCGYWPFGFRKTGVGTMRLAARRTPKGRTATASGDSVWPLNGTISVEAGELKVDCDQSSLTGLVVSAGAYLSGTGTVNNVTLEDGAGLRVAAEGIVPLKVNGTFTFGATGRIELANPNSIERRNVKVTLATFNGPVVGAANLANWTVSFNGTDYPADTWRCEVYGNKLIVGFQHGLMLKLR